MSRIHDALVAAALCGRGLDAEPLHPRDAGAMARGRALLPRGYPNPSYSLAGALLEHLERAGEQAGPARSSSAGRYTLLTVGGHFSHHAADYRRALARAGFSEARVVAVPLCDPRPRSRTGDPLALGMSLDARLLTMLVRAVVAADVLLRAGCEARARRDPSEVNRATAAALVGLIQALQRGGPLQPLLARLRERIARARPRGGTRPTPRALITGDFFSALTDGEGSLRLVARLERRGIEVTPAAVSEWLLYLLHHRATSDPRAPGIAHALSRLYRRCAESAGLSRTSLFDMADLAALAAPYYSPHLRGGSGHLEVGIFRAVERDRRADLVVSIKPFASQTSSSVSDAVIHSLARRSRTGFVAIETTGDAEAHVDSRLELACDAAERRVDEDPPDPLPDGPG